MNEEHNEHERGGKQQAEIRPEHEPRDMPRIYVASLSEYNAGRLHGTWIDADQDDEALGADIQAMLEASHEPIAEEWAIHDYEGFGPLRLGEYEDLATIAKVGRGIAEYGPAYAHWASITGLGDPDELDRFENVYYGHAESVVAYAEELLDDLGYFDLIERALPEYIQPYVTLDVEGFARDLEFSGDITTSKGDGGVYVFDPSR